MHALTYLDNEAIEGKHEKGKGENENPILMGREKIIDSIKFSCKLGTSLSTRQGSDDMSTNSTKDKHNLNYHLA